MGRICPLGGYVLYLDCLECEEKVCKGGMKDASKKSQRRIQVRNERQSVSDEETSGTSRTSN